jgi:lysylphosphatidylglycerol synthetase-like protein (DUF2156 family)
MAVFGLVVIQKGKLMSPDEETEKIHLTVVVVGILLIPVYDTLRVFTERILKKSSPFKPDRTHVHHLLMETGANHKKAALLLYLSNLLVIGAAFLLNHANSTLSIILLFILAAILSESINIKRMLVALAMRKKAKEAKELAIDNNSMLQSLDPDSGNLGVVSEINKQTPNNE